MLKPLHFDQTATWNSCLGPLGPKMRGAGVIEGVDEKDGRDRLEFRVEGLGLDGPEDAGQEQAAQQTPVEGGLRREEWSKLFVLA